MKGTTIGNQQIANIFKERTVINLITIAYIEKATETESDDMESTSADVVGETGKN